MRAAVHNRFSRRDPRRWAAGLGLAATALVILAVSALPALDWLGNRARIEHLRARIEAAPAAVARDYDPLVRGAALRQLAAAAVELVPEEIDLVEVFSAVRLAARANGIHLLSIQPVGSTPTARSLGEKDVRRVLLSLGGESELERISPFLADLRAAGHPATVRSFTAARPQRGAARFQFQLELGLLQRVDPPSEDAEEDAEDDSNPREDVD